MGRGSHTDKVHALPHRGERVEHDGKRGVAVRKDLSGDAIWCQFGDDTVMFSRRRGDVFRAFPGPANGPELTWIK